MRDTDGPRCGFPGCRIVARFDGTTVSARLSESMDSWMAGGPSEWDVSIDGVLHPKLVTQLGAKTYVLAKDLPAGVHLVELYKRSEAQNGTTQFLGYDFGEGTLLPPPARKKRRIEIVGDSSVAAFGVEGVEFFPKCPGLDYSARFQNFRLSMGARLGEALDAEVAGTVYSGKGIVKDIWRPDTETFPKVFQRALPIDPSSTWDFSRYVPEAVVSMIGGNDFAIGQPVDDGPATLAAFTDGYEAFVTDVRSRYPNAHVFLVTSPSAFDDAPEGRATRTNILTGIATVVARRNNAGDSKVYAVTPPIAAPEELKGCGGHGTPQFHQRLANELAPLIRARTGW